MLKSPRTRDECGYLSCRRRSNVKEIGMQAGIFPHSFMSPTQDNKHKNVILATLKGAISDIRLIRLQVKQVLLCTEVAAS